MIYTVTLNPALDYYLHMDRVHIAQINRSQSEEFRVGGKGINVSLVLASMGLNNTATGFLGGFVGDKIADLLKQARVNPDFIRLSQGTSRINVKLRADVETDINANGPQITQEEFDALLSKLSNLKHNDTLILSGSIPCSLSASSYERILESLQGCGIRFVIDAEKALLLPTLKYSPFLIKPNHHELGEIFQKACDDEQEIVACAKALQDMGARNILVSRGEKGALLLNENGGILSCTVPKGVVKNTTGAGDSTVAGFLVGYALDNSYATALKYAVAAGSATTFTGKLAEMETVQELLHELVVHALV